MSEADHVERIVERLRKDHPDPKARAELYASPDRWHAYIEMMMNGQDADEEAIGRLVKLVRAAETSETDAIDA
ncbi:MAG TPA: hypothetical protein VGM90_04215 [Kofleriaceae bacterium]|jgi:hypothetical protein